MVLISICPLHAQQLAKPIYLKNQTVRISKSANQWFNDFLASGKASPAQVIIQFPALPDAATIELLKSNGILLQQYLPDNNYIAIVRPPLNTAAIVEIKINGIIDVAPDWKIDQSLKQLLSKQQAVKVYVSLYKGVDDKAFVRQLGLAGGSIEQDEMKSVGIYVASVPTASVYQLAQWYGIEYMSPVYSNIPLDLETNYTARANVANAPVTDGGYGFTGQGVTVGVGDNTSAIYNIDLKDRVINYNPAPYEFHGIHVSGIVGGAGIVDPRGQGIAPHTGIVSQLYDQVWAQTAALHAAHNMTITNNSYAARGGDCKFAGIYDASSIALDRLSIQYGVLHVFAAGNDALLNCSPFPPSYATIAGGYQVSKNCVTVGSIDRAYQNTEVWSSTGPVQDGRLKPEMAAVGVYVFSPSEVDSYFVTLGTSQASPQVAGALSLLTERYRNTHAGANPRTDLLKAILLNGTKDVNLPGPDFKNGFGALDIYRSLQIMDSNRYSTGTITSGNSQNSVINVPPNTSQLKVMLYWHDPAGSPLAAKELVNDLDLQVTEPGGAVHLPLVPDPTPANVQLAATERRDSLNNAEQVTIHNPAAGNYTVSVKGFSVPTGSQDYVITYDLLPNKLQITNPIQGQAIKANDSLYIYWDAPAFGGLLTLQMTTDNGMSWNTIANNIADTSKSYVWNVPNISSGQCRIKLTRNATGESVTTGLFIISPQSLLTLDAIQCPGYIRMNWNSIANATGYEVMMKRGPYMQVIDTVNATSYTFSGLELDSFYYVAVRPIVDGLSGYRSIAVHRRPNDGTCTGTISDGDLMVQGIITPHSGRKFTSTELTNHEQLQVEVRNLDDAPANNYRVSYSLNGGSWQTQIFTTAIPANSATTVNIASLDLSALGGYDIIVAIENLAMTDPVNRNDTVHLHIVHLPNDPINLLAGFTDGFEDMPAFTCTKDSFGISPNAHWDYSQSTDTGRIRSFVNQDITVSGTRSISMDEFKNGIGNQNNFTGTFNLGNYDVANDEVRVEFDYRLHGLPKDQQNNGLFVRGMDTAGWINLCGYINDPLKVGQVIRSATLSLTDALRKNGQPFSTSTQLSFFQSDTSSICAPDYGNGVTIDNVKIYTVKNDVQLLSVLSPQNTECGLSGLIPLKVRIYNSVYQAQTNVQLYYQFDSGIVVNETISNINGKDTIDYTFSHKLDFSIQGVHHLNIWLVANGDTYPFNDSVLNYTIHNQPLVTVYPYRQDFEGSDGYWYTEGLRDSWQYGTPASSKINRAASGTKAWKTNLTGNYNNSETSYLYSPCFDLSHMTSPYLDFNLALDIEDCGSTLCDEAHMEFSPDGTNWYLLGRAGRGVNWYNDSVHQVWSKQDNADWHKTGIDLPKGVPTMQLRYVFKSDPGANFEGIAVDDISVYDRVQPGLVVNVYPNPTRDGQITIQWNGTEGIVMQIAIKDIAGKYVFRTAVTSTGPYNNTAIQTPHLASGVYLMKFEVDGKHFEYKIVYL